MAIPTLTPAQIFTNQILACIGYVANAINGNINIQPPEGQRAPKLNFAAIYTLLYSTMFANENGTSATAVEILSTQAVSVFTFLSNLHGLLDAAEIENLLVLPPYVANKDGTVTLS